ncbi:hypothetical protein IJG78_03310 [Candidatus Saccharibacteria bacterium]|nr:hypothetical protein [Candidatus Saccharibacteria bacterium]
MYDWRFSKLYPQGGEAYWHSTTASADITSYGLLASESALRVQHNDGKASGGALRCITQNFFFQKIFSPPAPPKPAGIRFRIYIPVAITLA